MRTKTKTKTKRKKVTARDLLPALQLAKHYIVKGIEQGAYTGCVVSGETALSRINRAITDVETNN